VEAGTFVFRAIQNNTELEGLYYVIKHQIVLKLLECYPGVVDCQSELKLFCGNRELSNPKSQTEEVSRQSDVELQNKRPPNIIFYLFCL